MDPSPAASPVAPTRPTAASRPTGPPRPSVPSRALRNGAIVMIAGGLALQVLAQSALVPAANALVTVTTVVYWPLLLQIALTQIGRAAVVAGAVLTGALAHLRTRDASDAEAAHRSLRTWTLGLLIGGIAGAALIPMALGSLYGPPGVLWIQGGLVQLCDTAITLGAALASVLILRRLRQPAA